MIKAGNHTVSDKGFTVVMENIGGVPRQAVVAELPGGISDEALAAFCAGPIEVLAEDGSTTATYTGPFRVVSHGLKLTRTSEDSDVAALTAQGGGAGGQAVPRAEREGKRPERPLHASTNSLPPSR